MSRTGTGQRVIGVTLRPARIEDSHRVWTWRNDPDTRRASLDSAVVPLHVHEAWFRQSLGRTDRRIYIVLADEVESGVVRLDVSGREAEVSIHLDPHWRGRGVGTLALRALTEQAFGSLGLESLVAFVKADNATSLNVFRSAGFLVDRDGEVVRLIRART